MKTTNDNAKASRIADGEAILNTIDFSVDETVEVEELMEVA